MTTSAAPDINEKVLMAFQAEHEEHLERIRGMLDDLPGEADGQASVQLDEMFRLAHSLKGGARVCDLRTVEALAHGLENIFQEVRQGRRQLDDCVMRTIQLVLDAVEDGMAAVQRGEQPAGPADALAAVQRLLEDPPSEMPPSADDDVAKRLLRLFACECPQYLAGLRRIVESLHHGDELTDQQRCEALRWAHNVGGAARAVGFVSIAGEGEALEALLRDLPTDASAEVNQQLLEHLNRIEAELADLAHCEATAVPAELASCDQRRPPVAEELAIPRRSDLATRRRPVDTVRISTESLDALLRSSQQLVADGTRQQQLSSSLEEMGRQVLQVQRDRDSIPAATWRSVRRLKQAPEVHALVSYLETVDRGLQSLHRQLHTLTAMQRREAWRLRSHTDQIQQHVRHARTVPAEVVFQGFRKLVRDLAAQEGKRIAFHVRGFPVCADRMIFQSLKDPLIHMLRNCVVHGVETPAQRTRAGKEPTARVSLSIEAVGNRLIVEVDDDGRGVDQEAVAAQAVAAGLITEAECARYNHEQIIDLIFHSGLSTSAEVNEVAGRGMGLSVVRDVVTKHQGEIKVQSQPRGGSKFRLTLPKCVATHRLLLVAAGKQRFALPLHGTERLLRVKLADLETIEGKPVVAVEDEILPLVRLSSLLDLSPPDANVEMETLPVVILQAGKRRLAMTVESLLAERDQVIQDLDQCARSERYLGAVVLEDASVVLVLNPAGLLTGSGRAEQSLADYGHLTEKRRRRRVLIVDDSFTTRTLAKSILEAGGYDVGVAVDGMEGLHQLRAEDYELVISDIEMPKLDGFALLEHIKRDHCLAPLPVILVTSRASSEDQARGLELGAAAYIVKQKFDPPSLLNTIRQVLEA